LAIADGDPDRLIGMAAMKKGSAVIEARSELDDFIGRKPKKDDRNRKHLETNTALTK
jgi:hypothetical protein